MAGIGGTVINAKDAVSVCERLLPDIEDIARYGGDPKPGNSGIVLPGFGSTVEAAALRAGPARDWVEHWKALRRELDAAAQEALKLAPPVDWPQCNICGRVVLSENRKAHVACLIRRQRNGRNAKGGKA